MRYIRYIHENLDNVTKKRERERGRDWIRMRQKRMKCEVIGTGALGTGPSLLLSVLERSALGGEDRVVQRILFNASENTQRISADNRIKLRGTDTVYLTKLRASRCLGLPGLTFALSGFGAAKLLIVGPKGTSDYSDAVRMFVPRRYPIVQTHDIESEYGRCGAFTINNGCPVTTLCVTIPINGSRVGEKNALSMVRSFLEMEDESSSSSSSSSEEYSDEENSVRSDHHIYIYAARVSNTTRASNTTHTTVTILDLDCVQSLNVARQNEPLRVLLENVDMTYIFVSSTLEMNSSFQTFREKIQTPHFVVSPSCRRSLLSSFVKDTMKMHELAPECFPLPCRHAIVSSFSSSSSFGTWSGDGNDDDDDDDDDLEKDTTISQTTPINISTLLCEHKITMWKDLLKKMVEEEDLSEDEYTVGSNIQIPFDVVENYLEALRIDANDDSDILSSISNVRAWRRMCGASFANYSLNSSSNDQMISVIMLGTAAAAPTKTRNCSSIFIDIPGGGILLDCGEGMSFFLSLPLTRLLAHTNKHTHIRYVRTTRNVLRR